MSSLVETCGPRDLRSLLRLLDLDTLSPEQRALCARQLPRHDLLAFLMRVFITVSPGDSYSHNWHIDAIIHLLNGLITGRERRVIITMPPRCLKSIAVSVALPAFLLGHDPSCKVIVVSYGRELAIKLSNDFRRVIESDWYRAAFPDVKISARKNTETEIETTMGGGRYATSVGGSITGRGADYIIIDDPLKPQDARSDAARKTVNEYVRSTLFSRFDDPSRGRMVAVMQRLHVDDLAGNLLEDGTWHHLNLQAIAELDEAVPIGAGGFHHRKAGDLLHAVRLTVEFLANTRRNLGEYDYQAQYQQKPVPDGGYLLKSDWIHRYDQEPPRSAYCWVYQSWDTALSARDTADYSVCITVLVDTRTGTFYILDVFRDRLEYPDLRRAVIDQKQRWNPRSVVIEDVAGGKALVQDLKRSGVPVIPFRPEGDKVTRFGLQTIRFESGKVLLPRSAPWLADLETELLSFPAGHHDDQADSLVQALTWFEKRPTTPGIGRF